MAACASVMDLMVERREAKGVHGEEAEKKKKVMEGGVGMSRRWRRE